MRTALYFALALSLAAGASSCVSSRPAAQPDPVPPAAPVVATLRLDSLAQLPAYLVPAPAGSTARQRRQWQKAQAQNLARAGVLPAKIKNSSLATAPGAVAVTRPAGPVAAGPQAVATDARKAGQRGGGGVATAPAATATGTTEIDQGLPWWLWLVFGAGCCAIGWRLSRGKWL